MEVPASVAQRLNEAERALEECIAAIRAHEDAIKVLMDRRDRVIHERDIWAFVVTAFGNDESEPKKLPPATTIKSNICATLKTQGPLPARTVAKYIGAAQSSVWGVLSRMRKQGIVTNTDGKWGLA